MPVSAPSDERSIALAMNPVSRETEARLDRLVELVLKWQRTTNLIAPSTIPHIWMRHVADSLQLLPLLPEARQWMDLGSGGGFPGLVIACVAADIPGAKIHLVESNGKKAGFLREAARALALPAEVHHGRIEAIVGASSAPVDVVVARALAPLSQLFTYAEPLLKRGAQAVFPKGQDVEAELTEASKYWNIEASLVPSKTDQNGRIVVVRRATRHL